MRMTSPSRPWSRVLRASHNLGNGRGFLVRQVIDHALAVTGRPIPVDISPRRPGDPPRLLGDASRICCELGWRPEHADLEQSLATAWSWHRQQHDGAASVPQQKPHA
jgi:UDP-glucose 4-epimerase